MNKKYFLGIIVELSQAFNMTDHKILIKKLEKYEICGRNLLWLKVIFQTKQYIGYKDDFSEQKSMGLLQLKCGVTQDSIVGALFFINKQMIFPLFRNTYH